MPALVRGCGVQLFQFCGCGCAPVLCNAAVMRSPRPVMSNVSFTVSFTLAFGPVALVQFVRGCSSDPPQGVGDSSPP